MRLKRKGWSEWRTKSKKNKKRIPGIEPGHTITFNTKKEIFWKVVAVAADVAGLRVLSTEPNSRIEKSKYFKYMNSINYIDFLVFVFGIFQYFFLKIDLKIPFVPYFSDIFLISFVGESFKILKICLYSQLSNILLKLIWICKSISCFRDIIKSLLALNKLYFDAFQMIKLAINLIFLFFVEIKIWISNQKHWVPSFRCFFFKISILRIVSLIFSKKGNT
jgi:hypothetical protein